MTEVKKILPTAHIEGVSLDNGIQGYCNKEETRLEGPWSFGEFKKQGRPTLAKDVVKMTEEELLDLPMHQYL